jgi:sigma-54 specific flagellar transcriptional regulator A
MFGGDDNEENECIKEGEYSKEGDNTLSTELPVEGLNLKEYISELEVSLIIQALEQQDWVVARAAEALGMRRTTLVEKMRKYNISKD